MLPNSGYGSSSVLRAIVELVYCGFRPKNGLGNCAPRKLMVAASRSGRRAQVLRRDGVDVAVDAEARAAVADIAGFHHEAALELLLHAERPALRVRLFAVVAK